MYVCASAFSSFCFIAIPCEGAHTFIFAKASSFSSFFSSSSFLLLSSVFDGREMLNTRISCYVQGEKKRPLFFASIVDDFFFTSLSVPTWAYLACETFSFFFISLTRNASFTINKNNHNNKAKQIVFVVNCISSFFFAMKQVTLRRVTNRVVNMYVLRAPTWPPLSLKKLNSLEILFVVDVVSHFHFSEMIGNNST